MEVLAPEALAQKLFEFSSLPKSTLFAGAGVSARLGLPTWGDLLSRLALVCTEFGDRESAALMAAKVHEGDLLGAATVYRISKKIPNGERYKRLVQLLSPSLDDSNLERLRPLMELRFTAVVTPNFDRALHHAYSFVRKRAPFLLELDDDSFKAGASLSEYFIARLHGRVDRPETICLDDLKYSELSSNDLYLDFLVNLLAQRPCCFMGFSFSDPAITHVLNIFKDRYGPSAFPNLHLAVIPSTADSALGQALGAVNIQVVRYDSAENHRFVWDAIRIAAAASNKTTPGPPRADISLEPNLPVFKRLTAYTFAQLKTRDEQSPLLDASKRAVVQSIIEAAGKEGLDDPAYHQQLAAALHIGVHTAKQLFTEVSGSLVAKASVERRNGKLIATTATTNALDEQMLLLAQAVIDRARVLTGHRVAVEEKPAVARLIEKVFLARAWDLAAFYSGAKIGYPADTTTTIDALLHEEKARCRISAIGALSVALTDLLQRPSDTEAAMLAEIGRCAFSVQLLLSAPRQSSFARFVLPTRIYFDSNVVMPAIVTGHPFQQLYSNVINRVIEAGKASRINVDLKVAYHFINEIVAHRELAIKTVSSLGLEDYSKLRKHFAAVGAHHGNVFVSAYGVAVGRQEREIRFSEFLARVAPYTNEAQLAEYLKAQGFGIDIQDPRRIESYQKIKTLLEIGYAKGDIGIAGRKDSILVAHEAAQLGTLASELERGYNSLFVTADLRLTNVIYTDNYLKRLSGAMLSNMGFVGIVDLLLGARVDGQSFSRLVWASPTTPDEVRLRDFLLQRAIAKYDAALLLKAPDVIDEAVRAAKEEVQRRGIVLSETSDIAELARSTDVLDRMENQFFERMRDAMDERASP